MATAPPRTIHPKEVIGHRSEKPEPQAAPPIMEDGESGVNSFHKVRQSQQILDTNEPLFAPKGSRACDAPTKAIEALRG